MALAIIEQFIDRNQNCRYGDSDIQDNLFTDHIGELYRRLRDEYGRCTGRVYIDMKSGETHAIGWVFVKRVKYDDCNDTYLRETWVTVLESCELDDPLALRRKTRHGEEVIGFKYKYMEG